MKLYELVGVSKINYTDKKDGSPKFLTRLHLTYVDDAEKTLVGSGVLSEVVPDRVFKDSNYEPTVGDELQLFYEPNYNGMARICLIKQV